MPRTRQSAAAYRREGDHYLIELNLREVRQLFNSLDPAPFLEKDLDDAAEEYLVSAVRELGLHHRCKIIVHLPAAGLGGEDSRSLAAAIHHYFTYRSRQAADERRQILTRGVASLAIGLAFLIVCLSIRQVLLQGHALDASLGIVSEGLLIMGWVAMWRPIEIFLYDWWPIQMRQRLYRHISSMPIQIKLTDKVAHEDSEPRR